MRNLRFLLLVLPALWFTACIDKVQSDYTPQMHFSYFINQHGDTLAVRPSADGETNVLDTMHLNDTLAFYVVFDALVNNLTGARFSWDTDRAEMLFGVGTDMAAALLPESDTLAGVFLLPAVREYRTALIPARYIPTAVGTGKMQIQAESDSKFSPNKVEILVPAIPSPAIPSPAVPAPAIPSPAAASF